MIDETVKCDEWLHEKRVRGKVGSPDIKVGIDI